MKKTNIAIIEPSMILTEGIKKIIDGSPDFKLVKSFHGNLNYSNFVLTGIDILLIDSRSITETQLSKFIHDCKNGNDDLIILTLQTSYLPSQIIKLTDGVIEMDDEPSTLFSKLRNVSKSKNTNNESCELSSREKNVLILVAKGKTNKEIANQLNISIHTVIAHRKNITTKTNIKSISGLTIYALLNNLISQDEVILTDSK
ncbi:MAG: helix-turn-helix transcriptional regulator [Paludibacteraceae bacterium]|nr:helix-turn-helix transcriptional regulator [Paludibacteraceae bacterium]